MCIRDRFVDSDPDYVQGSKVKRGVLSTLFCYQKLLTERQQRKRQVTLKNYIFKKPKEMQEPQPEPSVLN